MENASEPEAPRMSIQTKDLIRYTNHTIHQKKNHAKPIQKFHHNSTHSQPTTKHLDTLPADSEAPRPTPFPSNHKETQPFLHAVQRSADGSSNSRHTTPLATLPTRFNTSHGQCTASEGLLSRLTLQEGSCFLGGGNLRCFKKSRCLSGFRREFEIF